MNEINPIKDRGVIRKPPRISPNLATYDANLTESKWIPDKMGYFLIRILPEKKQIQVGISNYKDINLIEHLVVGTIDDRLYQKKLEKGLMESAYKGGPLTRIYQTIIDNKLVSRLDHAAYLGKELGRAWVALRCGYDYVQDGISL